MNEDYVKVQTATTKLQNDDPEPTSTFGGSSRAQRQGSVILSQVINPSEASSSMRGTVNFAASRKQESLQRLKNLLNG